MSDMIPQASFALSFSYDSKAYLMNFDISSIFTDSPKP